jgi:hypothetical protein
LETKRAGNASSQRIYGNNKCNYNKSVDIEFDPAKREKTLKERGLDFVRADEVFAGVTVTMEDSRKDYREPRFITVGRLDDDVVVVVWTPRENARRIFSMRKANGREIRKYAPDLG